MKQAAAASVALALLIGAVLLLIMDVNRPQRGSARSRDEWKRLDFDLHIIQKARPRYQ